MLLEVIEVVEPLTVSCAGRQVKILDDGYAWLFICRDGARHVVTAHCDPSGCPVHWYVDVVDAWSLDAEGFPVYDDLFLHVVAIPGGAVELRDADELETAFHEGKVTREQHETASAEAARIVREMQEGIFGPMVRTEDYLMAVRSNGG